MNLSNIKFSVLFYTNMRLGQCVCVRNVIEEDVNNIEKKKMGKTLIGKTTNNNN